MAEFIVGMATLQKRLDAISGPATGKAIMTRVQLRTLAAMKHRIARKTSNTSRTLHGGPVTPTSAKILGSQNALWLDRGTRRHDIKPKGKKALFFASQKVTTARFGSGAILKRRLSGNLTAGSMRKYGNAAYQYATIVHHPGTKAQPFISESVREAFAKSGLADAVVERWNKAG